MKTFQIASLVALATVGAAQLNDIPSCALNCFIGPLTSDGCSGLTDFACHCKQGSALLGKVKPCVEKACSAADQQATIAATQKTCKDAGAPIALDAPMAASSAPAAAPAAASSAAPVASSAAPASSAPASSAAAPAGYAASSAASSAVSSLASAVSSVIVKPTPATNGTHTASATPSQFTGAAAQASGAAALIGAAALAMLAL